MWITDRPPTAADADYLGCVVAATVSSLSWTTCHWSDVPRGRPWLRYIPPAPPPPAYPQPTTRHIYTNKATNTYGVIYAASRTDAVAQLSKQNVSHWNDIEWVYP